MYLFSVLFFDGFIASAEHCSSGHTNISDDSPKISDDVRRLQKVAEYFQAIFGDVSII